MTTNDRTNDLPDALRWQLRGLLRDVEPRRELWDGIASRIADTPRQPTASTRRKPTPRSFMSMLATAAVLAVAVGVGWQLRPEGPAMPVATVTPEIAPLAVAADAMSREYEGAVRELEASRRLVQPTPALAELDASAAAVRAAIAQDPDSRLLFDQLQRVYAQRLALTQRLIQA